MPLPRSHEYYVTGLKGWVQIRVAKRVPEVIKSAAIVDGIRRQWVDRWPEDDIFKIIPIKRTLTNIAFEGGRVIATISTRKMRGIIGITVGHGAIVRLLPDQVEKLKEMNYGQS